MKKFIKWISFWSILCLSFILAASYLYCFANGYRINWKTKKIQKTGMAIVYTVPTSASVYFDGKNEGASPVRLSYVLPGVYTVKVQLDGYQDWEQNIVVNEGYATSLNAEMFFSKPIVNNLTEKISSFNNDPGLEIRNSTEIWANNKLVTRLSAKILAVAWDNDQNNIIYQVGSELRVISADGLHDFSVVKLASDSPVKISFRTSTYFIYAQDGAQKQVQIRNKDNLIPATIKYLNF